jgi:hypothetical protein
MPVQRLSQGIGIDVPFALGEAPFVADRVPLVPERR